MRARAIGKREKCAMMASVGKSKQHFENYQLFMGPLLALFVCLQRREVQRGKETFVF